MASPETDALIFFVNGKKIVERAPDPEWTLLYYIRNKLRLTGTKLGCAEGGCGACTVMVSRYDRRSAKIQHISVNACLAPLCSMHGLAVTTVEGIGSTKTRLHPVQERLAKSHGSQCGFCTPGIVMSMYTLLRNDPQPSVGDLEKAFEGNLCRCTGYRPILEGFRTFTKECPMGEQCCQNGTAAHSGVTESNECGEAGHVGSNELNAEEGANLLYNATQEPIFPSELQMDDTFANQNLVFRGERITWYRPTSLKDLLNIKVNYPDARLVTGNTEIGIETKFKNITYPVLIYVNDLDELNAIKVTDDGVTLGASVTLSNLEEVLEELCQNKPEAQTQSFRAVLEMIRWFAGPQIRNVASIGGNLVTASPISDLNPLWMAASSTATILSAEDGKRKVPIDETFFPGYRQTALKADEILLSISIPHTKETEYFYGYKQAHRRDDDIAIVNAGMRVVLQEGSKVVEDVALVFGGMAPTTVMARKTMNGLIGKRWDDGLVSEACRLLSEDLPLQPGAPGGMEAYRKTLTTSFFFKFYLTVQQRLQQAGVSVSPVPDQFASATAPFHRDPSKGVQVYEEVPSGQMDYDAVGRPLAHMAAQQQTSGEAKYIDDIPPFQNELYLSPVYSSKAHAKLLAVDPSPALALPGVVDYISHLDVPGPNATGHILHDEEIFASEKVTCEGHIIGAVVAETQPLAQRAAKAVRITYEELEPIITIEDAIAAESFMPPRRTLRNGDVDAAMATSDHVIEGEMRVGGQEHFYLETQACIAVPRGEDGEIEVMSSTQALAKTQMLIAEALDVSANKVVCKVKRLGGAFGGKETRNALIAIPVAIAANKLGRPVRCMLDRDEDMISTGTRHPFLGRYKVGFTSEGIIRAVEIDFFCNAGNSMDVSYSVMERALLHFGSCYRVPNLRVTGYVCRTNTPSNTAYRGFGVPQAAVICERWMSEMAEVLVLPQEQVRELNMYDEGDRTPFNQVLSHVTVRRCWAEVKRQSDFLERQRQVDIFNRENRWKKKGLALTPVMFGVSFTIQFLNQAGSLVHIYTDGTVLVAHAGVEMGQGLHTKMIQVASRALRIPVSKIHISESSTNTVPNPSPTAASSGSDLNGMAVMQACQTLLERLEPYMNANPKGKWEDWVSAAYFDRVSLSATGFYRIPDIGYSWDTNSGVAYPYFTNCAACSEVVIDCLTGDHTVLRTDIVVDVGTSLNPAIDIGQIEGGFVQGYGLFTLEEQRYSPKGILYTRGPGMYKIPGFTDIPVEFNVSLLKGASNPKAVYSSKGVGEPPLILAMSVFYAIRAAIRAARQDAGHQEAFSLDSPATAERIRMACRDQFTEQFPDPPPGTYTPWSVNL